MAEVNLSRRQLNLENVTVWYDPDDEILRVNSTDPDLDEGVLDLPIERGSAADRELRELFTEYGLSDTFTGQRAPARNPAEIAPFLHFSPGLLAPDQPLLINLADEGHLIIQGTLGAGRSALLRAIIDELATSATADTLEIRVLGRGPLTLNGRRDPHPSPVVTFAPHESTPGQCLNDLAAEMCRREDEVAGAGASSLAQYNEAHPNRPIKETVVVLDCAEYCLADWSDLVSIEQVASDLDHILDVGPVLGLHVIFARTADHRLEGDALSSVAALTVGEDGACSFSDGMSSSKFLLYRAH